MLDANNYLGKMLAERYRLVRVIGRGASSLVFYAEDMMIKGEDGNPLPVAIKILDKDSGDYKMNSKSFRTEIHAVVGIPTNPHVVAIKDVSFHEDEHFIVMEYVSGKTLKQYIEEKNGMLSPREIVSISLQILQALRLAHESGVIHRDIKPQNIMIERADVVGKQVDIPGGADMPFVKLADFGIALLPDEDLFVMKDKGVGTVHYISPEQASGGRVDQRTDIYSLGVVMYEMATGNVPFDAQSMTGIISKHQTEMPFHVRNYNTEIPVALDHIIFTAMQKNPSARYKDALAMERKLRDVMNALQPDRASGRSGVENLLHNTTVKTEAVEMPIPPKSPKAQKPPKAPKPPKPPKAQKSKKESSFFKPGYKNDPAKKKRTLVMCSAAIALIAVVSVFVYVVMPLLGNRVYDSLTAPKLLGTMYSQDSTYSDGIVIGNVEYVYSDEYDEGVIVDQEPSPGVTLTDVPSLTLHLKVSRGPEMTDFVLPKEHRESIDTAKSYLRQYYGNVSVIRTRPAETPIDGAAVGEVIGAYYLSSGEEISLDGAKICKNKIEKIIIEVQPDIRETVLVSIPLVEILSLGGTVEDYLAEHYDFLTVGGKKAYLDKPGTEDDFYKTIPPDTVIGVSFEDGSEVVFKDLEVLEFTIIREPMTIHLITAGNP